MSDPPYTMHAMNSKIIRVQGKGRVFQSPDRVRVAFSITGKDADFTKAVEQGNLKIEALRVVAESCGIARTEMKTISFDIEEETKYDSGRRHHIGFICEHKLSVCLPIDQDLLGHFLSAVIQSKAKPEMTLTFEVSDTEELKQKVLANAVENAKRRAQTIATASGVTLGSIQQIEYGYSEIRISSEPVIMEMHDVASGPIAPDFEPDDVEAEDTVTITWEIGR